MRALSLLPGRDFHPTELNEYNRRTAQEARRVRDFAALHTVRSGRTVGAVWPKLACTPPPESLAHTLDQFGARGRLPFYEEEIFGSNSWLAVLLGMGVIPRATDPGTASADPDAAEQGMARLARTFQDIGRQASAYSDYLAQMKAAA